MDDRHLLAAASRDGHLALRRVERHQALLDILAHSGRLTSGELATRLGVSTRTVERDIERLRDAGVPFTTCPGRSGGISFTPPYPTATIEFDTTEVAAVISALAIVGANSSPSASSATAKLVRALRDDDADNLTESRSP